MQESKWNILDSKRQQGNGISTTTWNLYTEANWIEGNLDQSSVCNMGIIKLNCAKMCSMRFLIKHTFSILLTFTNVILHFGFANNKMVNGTEGETLPFSQELPWPLQTNSQLVQVYGKKRKSTGENKAWNVHAVKQGIFSSRYLLNCLSLMLNCGSWHCWLREKNKGKHQWRYTLTKCLLAEQKKNVLFS